MFRGGVSSPGLFWGVSGTHYPTQIHKPLPLSNSIVDWTVLSNVLYNTEMTGGFSFLQRNLGGEIPMEINISNLFIQLTKRAEKIDRQALIDSFVNVGPLITVLKTVDNQILYGRRGTGKTHALVYLSETVLKDGDIPIYLDLRSIGSTGGLYSDGAIPLAERATRLLVDTLATIHDELIGAALDDAFDLNLAEVAPILDNFADAISEVVVTGSVIQEIGEEDKRKASSSDEATLAIQPDSLSFGGSSKSSVENAATRNFRMTTEGHMTHRVHFGKIGALFNQLISALKNKRIWILIDEWSVVPLELQPYLADLLRRAIFPAKNVTVKIGAIEKRSRFQLSIGSGDYLGIELGGDASADLNMDDYMVFDNDETRAYSFFRSLIYRHVKALAAQQNIPFPFSEDELIQTAFTQDNVFKEFVRAAEGIPRDAFCILSIASQRDHGSPIQMETIRKASKTWYQRDKETAVSSNPKALDLLHWIIDEVIAHRKARAFLLRRNTANEIIDILFDSRVLHLLKKNIAAHDQPGNRYDVYTIDYGCYVDLLSTSRSPQGLLGLDMGGYTDVPPDDYRAIRRAILDLEDYEKSNVAT